MGKVYVAFFVLLFCACVEVGETKCDYLVHPDKVQQYNVDKLSEIFACLDFIPLETGDDFLLSNIRRIKKRNGRYYVQHNEHQLDVFDGEGKYLAKIGSRGQGPGEYSALCDFDADKEYIYIVTRSTPYL